MTATVEKNAVTMKDPRSGAELAQAPLAHILGVQAFPSKSALLDGWVGLSFGGAAYFTSPTVSGGNLVIVNAQGGQSVHWAFGNRSGMFARKADYTGFCMMRFGLAMGASRAARGRLGGPTQRTMHETSASGCLTLRPRPRPHPPQVHRRVFPTMSLPRCDSSMRFATKVS